MNAILLSALWGVVMMFTGLVSSQVRLHGRMAVLGMALLAGAAWLDLVGISPFGLTGGGMLSYGPTRASSSF